jgi:hypothetical protein
MIIKMRRKINELNVISVSSIIKACFLNSLVIEEKLIQVTSMATKHANKSYLSWFGVSFLTCLLGRMALDWMGSEFWSI